MNEFNSSAAADSAPRRRFFVRQRSVVLLFSLIFAATVVLTGAVDSRVPPAAVTLTEVRPSTFRLQVEKPGVVEPLQSDAVHSSCYWKTTILSIVPEGTWVQKGDVVCVLDSSEIEDFARSREVLLIKYRNRFETAVQEQRQLESQNERRLAAARFKHQTATRAQREYQSGTFPNLCQELERNLTLLGDQARAAREQIRHTERLWAVGAVSRSELNRGTLELLKAERKYDELAGELNVLTEFTHPRSTLSLSHMARDAERDLARTELANGLAMTKSRLTTLACERTIRIYENYYRRAIDSIKACTLTAPCDGQVVHGNSWYMMSRGITQIEVGARVRNLQKVFEIPDSRRLKVSVPLEESLIYRVSTGMPVTVSVPGYEELEVAGEITKVSRYPRRRSSWTPHLKDFWLDVELFPTDEQRELLYPKANVEVTLSLAETPDALQIPRSAVTSLAGHNFVYVYNGRELDFRKIDLGDANSESVCVIKGLESGDQLVTSMLPEHQQALDERLREDLGVTDE